jgi:hypothetical protein
VEVLLVEAWELDEAGGNAPGKKAEFLPAGSITNVRLPKHHHRPQTPTPVVH